jgi:hypothetical protein
MALQKLKKLAFSFWGCSLLADLLASDITCGC